MFNLPSVIVTAVVSVTTSQEIVISLLNVDVVDNVWLVTAEVYAASISVKIPAAAAVKSAAEDSSHLTTLAVP